MINNVQKNGGGGDSELMHLMSHYWEKGTVLAITNQSPEDMRQTVPVISLLLHYSIRPLIYSSQFHNIQN